MRSVQHKVSPINLRALPSQKELIDKAASLLHKSRSDFMLEAACTEATNVLLSQRLFFADEKEYSSFLALLDSPIKDNLGLRNLLQSKSPWEE